MAKQDVKLESDLKVIDGQNISASDTHLINNFVEGIDIAEPTSIPTQKKRKGNLPKFFTGTTDLPISGEIFSIKLGRVIMMSCQNYLKLLKCRPNAMILMQLIERDF